MLRVPGGKFYPPGKAIPANWFYLTIVVVGRNAGLNAYFNDVQQSLNNQRQAANNNLQDRVLSVGGNDAGGYPGSVMLDELVVWDFSPGQVDVEMLYNSHN